MAALCRESLDKAEISNFCTSQCVYIPTLKHDSNMVQNLGITMLTYKSIPIKEKYLLIEKKATWRWKMCKRLPNAKC